MSKFFDFFHKLEKPQKIILAFAGGVAVLGILLFVPAVQNLALVFAEKIILHRELAKPEKWVGVIRKCAILLILFGIVAITITSIYNFSFIKNILFSNVINFPENSLKTIPAIQIITYLYITLPIFIFFVGWSKFPYAIILGIIIAASFALCIKDIQNCCASFVKGKFVVLLLLILELVFLSGIGGYVWQNGDHIWRNELFNILVEKQWPVTKVYNLNGIMQTRGLIYYIGFWLPSAVIGKVFGLEFGYFFMMLWACLGVFLTWYHTSRYLKKYQIWVLFAFFMFSGLDLLGTTKDSSITTHLEWWTGFQFSSFTTQLFWVFNQAIYAWIILLMILQEQNNRHIIFLWACAMIECTFPFVGMLPFLMYRIFENIKLNVQNSSDSKNKLKTTFSNLFTFENVIGGGAIGILSLLYLFGNSSGQKFRINNFLSYRYFCELVRFLIIEVGIYFVLAYRHKNSILYWITLITLCTCPLIRIGGGGDFCMRASIPALVVLFLLFFETWSTYCTEKNFLACRVMAFIFILGFITPFHEVVRTIKTTDTKTMAKNIISGKRYDNKTVTEDEVLGESIGASNNFSGNIENNLFFKYIAKKK